MALINFTAPQDGETADAADVVTPLNTIYNEFNGNIDNANIKSGAAIDGSKLADTSITPNKTSTTATSNTVATLQTTTSTSYTDLSTSGPAVTVTVGTNGLLLVCVSFYGGNSTSNAYAKMSFALSGANTLSADDTRALRFQMYSGGARGGYSRIFLLTGLTPGSTVVTAKYAVETGGSGAGTGTFGDRNVWAVPL